jgi:hypothetical protein
VHSHLAWGDEPSPKSFKKAMLSFQKLFWLTATDKEMKSHADRKTWVLVPRTEAHAAGQKVLRSLWVLKDKLCFDGNIKEKARVVCCGNDEIIPPGFETFAPTAQTTSLRVLLSIAAAHNLPLWNGDFSVAFLHADALKTTYMEQPEGYAPDAFPRCDWVCKLIKGLYGTKSANRGWSLCLHAALTKFGLKRTAADHGLYYCKNADGSFAILFVHVDDIVSCCSKEYWTSLVDFLCAEFEFTDLGPLQWVLGMRVTTQPNKRTIRLDQEKFVTQLAAKFAVPKSTGKPKFSTPAHDSKPLTLAMNATTPEDRAFMKDKPYRHLVGCLLYLVVCTRVDLAQAVGALCRFQQNPGPEHWYAAKRALRYVVDTAYLGLTFGAHKNNPSFELVGFCDADWGGCTDTRRSTSGYIFTLFGDVISYKSVRQKCVALSTTEAEYIAAAEASRECIWLVALIDEISTDALPAPVKINEDNKGAIFLTKNPVGHGKNKHIQLRHHFIRELVQGGRISLIYCSTLKNLADMLTKPLGKQIFLRIRRWLMGA